jgi:hypothetical protein
MRERVSMPLAVRSSVRATICICLFFFGAKIAGAQTKQTKPLLIIKVESERTNLTQPSSVTELRALELKELQETLKHDLSSTFEIIPESDKRDCIELSVVLEKLKTDGGFLYIGSSAIAVGKGESDLLYTHNPIVQPTIKRISSALTFQLSMIQIQAALGK